MGSLFGALQGSVGAMRAFERSLNVVQNNVANVNTPGFVKQRHVPEALRFDADAGVFGGVAPGEVINYRNRYTEASIRERTSNLSRQEQAARDLTRLEPLLPVEAGAGISGAVDRLFQSFSQLTVSPNDMTARQIALDRADEVAAQFNATSASLAQVRGEADEQLRTTVNKVNELASRIAELNQARRANSVVSHDPGLDAEIHNLMEELSGEVNFASLEQGDGTIALFIGGNRLLAIGNRTYPIQASFDGATRVVRDSEGEDISRYLTGGKMAAHLDTYNRLVPELTQSVNDLAESIAGEINFTLQGGVDFNGGTPGAELFSFDVTAGAAFSLRANDLDPSELALAAAGQPGGNGNAVALTQLAERRQPNGYTFAESFGILGSRLGRAVSDAESGTETYSKLVMQAKSQRQEESGVSLDEEASQMIQYQRAYQAAAQLFRTLNEMTQTVIDMAR